MFKLIWTGTTTHLYVPNIVEFFYSYQLYNIDKSFNTNLFLNTHV